MWFIPIVKRFCGFLAIITQYGPCPTIRKLRDIIYTNKYIYQQKVHDIMQAEETGSENTSRDIFSVLGAYSSFLSHNVTYTAHLS